MNRIDHDEHDLQDTPEWDAFLAAGSTPAPSADVLNRTKAAVRQAVNEEHDRALAPVVEKPRRRVGLVLAGAAALAALLVAAPTITTPGSEQPAATATAASFLREVATKVPQVDLSDAKPYWMTKDRSVVTTPDSGTTDSVIASWYTDGKAFSRYGSGKVTPQGSDGWAIEECEPAPTCESARLTWDEMRGLPADAEKLRGVLDARLGAGKAGLPTLSILMGGPVTPEVRQALLTLAADYEGIELAGQVTDSEGRTGTKITQALPGFREVYVVVSDSGSVLEISAVHDDGIVEKTTVLSQGPSAGPGR